MAGGLRDFFNFSPKKEPDNSYWTCPKCRTRNSLESTYCVNCERQNAPAQEQPDKVRIDKESDPLVEMLVQLLENYLNIAQVPSREVADEAAKAGVVIKAPQEIALAPIDLLDTLANRFINSNRIMATGSGAVMGLPGGLMLLATIPTDISAVAYYSFRTISAIAQGYGYETRSEEGRTIALLLFAGANGIDSIEVAGTQIMLGNITRNVLTKPYRDLITKQLVQEVANQIAQNVLKRGLGRFVPVLGSVVGGTANFIFLSEVGERAKMFYRGRLLEERKVNAKRYADNARPADSSRPESYRGGENGSSNGANRSSERRQPVIEEIDELGRDNPI